MLPDFFYYYYIFIIIMFFIFALSLFVLFSRNSVLSVICLIIIFLLSSFCMFIIDIKFLALLYLGTYVGAIFVLFLFVTILIDTRIESWLFVSNSLNFSYFVSLFSLKFLFILNSVVNFVSYTPSCFVIHIQNISDINYAKHKFFYKTVFMNDLNIISFFLYTQYYYCFVIVSLILLLVMVGSLSLISNSHLNKNKIKKDFI